jgi:hypothetical protein
VAYNGGTIPEVNVPKRNPSKSRTRTPPGSTTPAKRPVAPASVRRPIPPAPTGSAVWGAPPAVEVVPRPAAPRPTSASRFAPSSRLARPARASSLAAITDYHYVLADLRRIGILAAIAFLVLIGLTFVIH